MTLDIISNISRLALDLGAVNRATLHQDGVTPESDTTHTVMLGLIAIELAEMWAHLKLQPGLVAQMALVHDLVEARCGDTPTLQITEEQRAEKEAREKAAMESLRADFAGTATLRLLSVYEHQRLPEARFVRYLDKVMPKLTHAHNNGAYFERQGLTLVEVMRLHNEQMLKLEAEYPEFPELAALLADACGAAEVAYARRTT